MAYGSILPASLTMVEVWLTRMFVGATLGNSVERGTGEAKTRQLLFALLTIGPWLLLLVYDILLYMWRSIAYELPWIGGRARGRQRPRAPSLTERPSGHRRNFSLPGMSKSGTTKSEPAANTSSKFSYHSTLARPAYALNAEDG